MKKAIIIIICIILAIAIILLGYGYARKMTEEVKNPIVTMEIADYGTIKVELYPDMAPNTVANFVKLVQEGYYDGLDFHRTIPGFMIQGGQNTGADALDYCIPGEFMANGYQQNTLKHEKGVISMARADYSSMGLAEEGYNSASDQFFIMDETTPSLDGYYAAFGRVIEGMDVVEKIADVEVIYRSDELAEDAEVPTDEEGNQIASDTPVNKPVITSMTVETFGVDYGEPETVEPFDYTSWMMEQYYSGQYTQ